MESPRQPEGSGRRHPAAIAADSLKQTMHQIVTQDYSILHLDALECHDINASTKAPSWLPVPHPHQYSDDELVHPPSRIHPCSSSRPFTGFEWAFKYSRMARRLADRPVDDFACWRRTDYDNPSERFLGRSHDWNQEWEMCGILESNESMGCLVADTTWDPRPEPQDAHFGRGEITCLIVLLMRQLKENWDMQENQNRVSALTITFTKFTARVLQAYVDLSDDDARAGHPKVYIIQRFETPVEKTSTGNGDPVEARRVWSELMSWFQFGPSSPQPGETKSSLPRQHRVAGKASKVGAAEDTFSTGSVTSQESGPLSDSDRSVSPDE